MSYSVKTIGCYISIANKKICARFSKLLEKNKIGFTMSGWAVLHQLWQKDGLTQQEISDRSGIAKPNISNYISKLEKNDFVVRVVDPIDKRNYHIYMTNKAKQAKDLSLSLRKQAEDEILTPLNEVEKKDLERMLSKLNE